MRDLAAIFRDHLSRPGREAGPAAPPPAQAPAPALAPMLPPATPHAAEAAPKPRRTRLGVCPGDPPAPVVDPKASRTLVILELAGARPRLLPDGGLELAHPEHASPELRAAARLHQHDICALLVYRALLEECRPVEAEAPPLPSRYGDDPP